MSARRKCSTGSRNRRSLPDLLVMQSVFTADRRKSLHLQLQEMIEGEKVRIKAMVTDRYGGRW
ncbi:hypothetical protein [Pseudorhizobium flavum]|uniref:Ribosome recycling factor n=1 Tax=Pseudorhizobium flavum TaxID=1335061 RepID=A0A7X0DFW8_9HYPH|nr:hypothetical protein [Pseudorhizobium flavum]MBB6181609.1 ribosome recycling factor [Pseudorhizobium flavum]CAD6619594.1 hypothetical protein RFYW14_03854 [Pseudorhizobium flavum]